MLKAAVALLAIVLSSSAPASAQVLSRPAAEMARILDAPARLAGLRIDEVLATMKLKPGQVVADLGAGTGVFTPPLARAVGPTGKVYSIEVDQDLVDVIAKKVADEKVANARVSLGQFTDPMLPARDVDVAFFHDVIHHIADKPGYLKTLTRYLKPAARIVVIDPDGDKGGHKGQPELQVTREQLAVWMKEIGFVLDEDVKMFAEKWFVIYRRP